MVTSAEIAKDVVQGDAALHHEPCGDRRVEPTGYQGDSFSFAAKRESTSAANILTEVVGLAGHDLQRGNAFGKLQGNPGCSGQQRAAQSALNFFGLEGDRSPIPDPARAYGEGSVAYGVAENSLAGLDDIVEGHPGIFLDEGQRLDAKYIAQGIDSGFFMEGRKFDE